MPGVQTIQQLKGIIGVSGSMLQGRVRQVWGEYSNMIVLQQKEYDELPEVDPDAYYFITG